jgi:hypothetical protein
MTDLERAKRRGDLVDGSGKSGAPPSRQPCGAWRRRAGGRALDRGYCAAACTLAAPVMKRAMLAFNASRSARRMYIMWPAL